MNADDLAVVTMERGVLGAAMLGREEASIVTSLLTPNELWNPDCQMVLDAITALDVEGSPIDVTTVITKLWKQVEPLTITQMTNDACGYGAMNYYCDQIIKSARKRNLLNEMKLATSSKLFDEETIQARLEVAFAAIDRGETTMTAQSVMEGTIKDIEAGTTTGVVPTPWDRLNDMISGARHGEVTLVAARTSVGKSAFTLSWALNAARSGYKVVFVSLEMGQRQIGNRFLAQLSGVEGRNINCPRYLSADELERIRACKDIMQAVPLTLVDESRAKVAKICSSATGEGTLLIVDYVQLVDPDSKKESREQQVAQISRSFKLAAKNKKLAVVLVAQLSREPGKRKDPVPKLSDLRESGALENDADTVLMLHRPGYGNANEPETSQMQVYVRKQRNGPTGKIEMMYDRARQRITETSWRTA